MCGAVSEQQGQLFLGEPAVASHLKDVIGPSFGFGRHLMNVLRTESLAVRNESKQGANSYVTDSGRKSVGHMWIAAVVQTLCRLPAVAATTFTKLLGHEAVEVCGLLCSTAGLEPVAYHELARGTLDHAIVMPRDVFRIALLAHAKAVVIGHNHPTGSVDPSPEDV